jgi:hypothetical protein
MLEGGFDLLLELRLAQDRFLVALGRALEQRALVCGHLPDGLEFVQAQEPGQAEGIARIFFVVVRADEFVVARVAHDQLLDVRTQELPEPAGEIGFFERQALVGCDDGLHLGEEFFGLGGDAPELALRAVVIELGEHAILRVSIQPQPCYG